MANEQQTYGGGGVSIAGLIEHLGREAERLNSPASATPSGARTGASPEPQRIRCGQLSTPPAAGLAELRRQQAEFDLKRREVAWRNRWMAVPALAPVAVPALLESAATAAYGARIAPRLSGPINLPEREAWQRIIQGPFLNTAEKGAVRKTARTVYARANGLPADEMNAQVHHSDPLQWAHLKPDAHPNRLANLWALEAKDHNLATQQWRAFDRSLQGRTPSQAELLAAKLRIDRSVERLVKRPGLPRARPSKKEGPF